MKKQLVIMWVMMLGLNGCFEPANDSGNTATSIGGFTITSASTSQGGLVALNAMQNQGQGDFLVSWDVTSSDPYYVSLAVSSDSKLTDDDIRFFGQNCGSNSSIFSCGAKGQFACQFTSNNRIFCGDSSTGQDLTSFLVQIPLNAYIIFQACDGLFTDCKTETREVQFQ